MHAFIEELQQPDESDVTTGRTSCEARTRSDVSREKRIYYGTC